MTKKYDITVLRNADFWGENGEIVEVIKRTITAESIGNFNPMFTMYKGKKYLVKSKEGDLSDPFRREESYAKTLFIDIGDNPSWVGSPELAIARRRALGYDVPNNLTKKINNKKKIRRGSTSTAIRGIR